MSAPPSPSGDAPWARETPPWTLVGVVATLLIVRVLVAGSVHLTEDEAYYRLWAQAPALGYDDHPPMIAWWIWLGVHVAGDDPLGVRLLPILGSAVTSAIVFDLARLAGGSRATAARAGIWYNATLLVAAGGFLAVPDSPAALFWALSLWSAFRALRSGPGVAWWLAAGAAAGLASLSKYSALFLGPGMFLWLISTTAGRASLRTPGPWLALAAAAALFALNLGWNATHAWLTFAKQFGRIAPHRLAPRYLLEFLATEALLLNPVLAAFLLRLGRSPPKWELVRRSANAPVYESSANHHHPGDSTWMVFALGRDRGEEGAAGKVWPFLATSAPFIGYLLLHSLHDRIQAHWPAPVYPALAICAAFAAEDARGAWRVARTAAPWFGFAACAAAALYIALPLAGIPLRFDPALPVRGWGAFARDIEGVRRGADAGWVGTTSYGLAAELAGEAAIGAPILQISERERWRGLRQGAWADTSRPGLLVDLPRRIDVVALRRCFVRVQPLGGLDRGPRGEKPKRYAAVLVTGPRSDLVRDGCGAGSRGPE